MSNVAASDAVAPIAADRLLDLVRRPARAHAFAREYRVESDATRARIDRVADIRPSSTRLPSKSPVGGREGRGARGAPVFIIHSCILLQYFIEVYVYLKSTIAWKTHTSVRTPYITQK